MMTIYDVYQVKKYRMLAQEEQQLNANNSNYCIQVNSVSTKTIISHYQSCTRNIRHLFVTASPRCEHFDENRS